MIWRYQVMRKVRLKMEGQQKYEVIRRVVENDGNKTRAACMLGCSRASIYRMIAGYKSSGKEYFVHGNTGRSPVTARSERERAKIIKLYNTKYWDASFAFFSELLLSKEGISVSPSLVRNILMNEGILSPYATRRTRREMTRRLKAELNAAKIKSGKKAAESRIIAVEDAHAHRPRCAYFGELLQMDASIHLWFGDRKTALHAAVDDSTGILTGARIEKEETLMGYYHVLYQTLVSYGIPYMLFTDRRTVFEYAGKTDKRVENDTFTQFSYALKQLGIGLRTSSVPQAKGRIERVFGALQRRLPILFRAAGVKTIEHANAFLDRYIREYNAQFALGSDNISSVFEKQPGKARLNLILAVLTPRVVDSGHAVKFGGRLYMPMSASGNPVHFRKGSRGLVVNAFDGKLFFTLGDKAYALSEIPARETASRELDNAPRIKARRTYVPPMSHPWKLASFEWHMKQQPHRHADDDDPLYE
jgi:transposase